MIVDSKLDLAFKNVKPKDWYLSLIRFPRSYGVRASVYDSMTEVIGWTQWIFCQSQSL